MILRIVRMHFTEKGKENFLVLFDEIKEKIRFFEGCKHLEIMEDADNPYTVCSYSIWDDSEALNNYRYSDFFRSAWPKIKSGFNSAPEAFSLNALRTTDRESVLEAFRKL